MGAKTVKYGYWSLLRRGPSMIGQSNTSYITSNWLLIDTRDKRVFAVLHRN
jgi:hypothetical protein